MHFGKSARTDGATGGRIKVLARMIPARRPESRPATEAGVGVDAEVAGEQVEPLRHRVSPAADAAGGSFESERGKCDGPSGSDVTESLVVGDSDVGQEHLVE